MILSFYFRRYTSSILVDMKNDDQVIVGDASPVNSNEKDGIVHTPSYEGEVVGDVENHEKTKVCLLTSRPI